MFIIGMLIGAIIASAGFLIFGNKNKGNNGNKEFDPSKFNNGERPSFSREDGDFDFENFDPSNLPERPTERPNKKTTESTTENKTE
jgi:hypothetical protein